MKILRCIGACVRKMIEEKKTRKEARSNSAPSRSIRFSSSWYHVALFRVTPMELSTFAIVVYFAGWWYKNAFISSFGVNPSSMTMPVHTVFIHAFSVVTAIPDVVTDLDNLKSIVVPVILLLLFLLCLRRGLIYIGRKRNVRLLGRSIASSWFGRLFGWALLLYVVYSISIAAGSQEATELSATGGKRAVVLFDSSLIADSSPESVKLRRITEDSEQKKIGLVWRDSNETILVRLGSQNVVVEYLRIDNEHIAVLAVAK